MNNKRTMLGNSGRAGRRPAPRGLGLLLVGSAALWAAGQPGTFSEGSTVANAGWKFSYTAVARPPISPGQHIRIQTDATHTDGPAGETRFHRFFTDPVNRTYFGYDVVVEPSGQANGATMRFQPLSLRADQLPEKYASTDFKPAAAPHFPAQTFKSGQIIAVDVMANPGSGQKVVDYIQVAYVQGGKTAAGGTSAAAARFDLEKAKALGNPGAPVRLEVFSDFQCPGCRAFHEMVLPLLMKDYINAGKVYVINHEFPLPMHPFSREAAAWATAAAHVGKYQAVADALFREQQNWGSNGNIPSVVEKVLTPDERKKVEPLVKAPETLAQVQQDVDLGLAQRVNQTPTVVVSRGDKRYPFPGPGLDNYSILKSLIDQLLK